MKHYFIVNKKGFINIYILVFFVLILGIVQVYIQRYRSTLKLREASEQATYCEMFIFHQLSKQVKEESEVDVFEEDIIAIDDDNDELELEEDDEGFETEEDVSEEHLRFKNCAILLNQHNDTIEANYQIENDVFQMIIQLDSQTKEISDVAYGM